MFQLMDTYTAVLSVVFLAFCEVVAVSWIFGKILLNRQRWPMVFFCVSCLITRELNRFSFP